MDSLRPRVGLLFNATTPALLAHAPDLVEHLSMMPNRYWLDFGSSSRNGQRFHFDGPLLSQFAHHGRGRTQAGHGLGLSLPTAGPLDIQMALAAGEVERSVGGLLWYSEHLNLFQPPGNSWLHGDAGLPLPVVYDEESYILIGSKLELLRSILPCPLLLENGSFYTPIPEQEMEESEFLNRLFHAGLCSTLLDFHNLLVNARNGGPDPVAYLEALDPASVVEVHLAGGMDLNGFYTDSHSSIPPEEVWELAETYLPRCPNLRAITLEYEESFFDDIGLNALTSQLERMHLLT
ncbi:MAG: DUF692 family multinuclear iron-containing protein [Cyanobacteriota bacterium]